ncbi:MAG: hypothetical protein IPM54_31545 [Polyangiaceae bacterium]|nr:hypothetical protein [Polyangiaceae bacterium]
MNSLRKPLSAFFSMLAVSALGAFGTTGCQTEAFCWDNCAGDAPSGGSGTSVGGAGGTGGQGQGGGLGGEGGCLFGQCGTSSGQAGSGGCVQTNGGIEICDNLDNDCNGMTDDSADINFNSPKTCGTCDNNCYALLDNANPAGIACAWDGTPNTPGTCQCGQNGLAACAAGYYDLNGDCKCEYYCVKTADDDTLCNNKDDDCDNLKDEDVDVCTSTTDCGACGNNCVVLHGTPDCTSTAMAGEACTPANTKCSIAACDPGWIDLDKSYATGCEYACNPTNGGVEKCGDGIDNDCDGLIDSADDLSGDVQIGALCFGDPKGICGLIANAGTFACVGNDYQCVGPNVKVPGQVPETCNNLDDDCNGQVDDNPGDAGMLCGISNIYPCKRGTQQCINGALQCIGAINPSTETCDGIDNDCDGMIDDNPSDVGMQCGPATDVGACQFGVTQCVAGVKTCQGAVSPTTETCNMIDDDCDGTIDDVSGVGTPCGQSSTSPCMLGTFQCVGTNLACVGNVDPTTEICNMVDDDCDGSVDEGLPPQQCVPAGTPPNLVYGGSSQCKRGTQACGGACTGFVGPTNEVCDAIDNDCDGVVDDNLMLGPCNVPVPPPAGATSPCMAGTFQCTSGVQTCQGSVGPTSPIDACGVDSNCDGVLTGQPNLQNDVANCGSCGNNCYASAVHAIWGCVNGMCAFQGCENGYYDLDGNNTCEYACQFTQAQESCNGLDDNCNGAIDENVQTPTPVQVCGVSPAATRPECTTGISVACIGGAWQCTFPAGVCTGGCSSNDEICDLLDNDCDGNLNENVANYGQACASDDANPVPGHGACRTTGTYLCAGASATTCSAVKANCAGLPGGCTELCDGVDNDCDGSIDEVFTSKGADTAYFVKPAVTKIAAAKWIYSYEASRPTATTISAGSGNGYQTSAPAGTTLDKTRACSVPSKLPWFNVTPLEVEQTCVAMGGSICATADWTSSCQATASCSWGYNPRGSACTSAHTGTKFCNLQPYDFVPGTTGDQDGLLPTASSLLQNCWSDWSNLQGNTAATNRIYDITGNIREITRSAPGTYPLMGGAFNADTGGSTCTFDFYTTTNNAFQLYDLGFRCCFTSDPTL